MAVRVKVILDPTQANAQLAAFQAAVVKSFTDLDDKATQALRLEGPRKAFQDLGQEADRQLRGIQNQTQQTAKETEGILKRIANKINSEMIVNTLSPTKELVKELGVELGLMTQNSEDAAVGLLDMAEKGAAAGAVLGPAGALLGAFGGALAQLAKDYENNKETISQIFAAFVPGFGSNVDYILAGQDIVKDWITGVKDGATAVRDASGTQTILNNRLKDGNKNVKESIDPLKERNALLAEQAKRIRDSINLLYEREVAERSYAKFLQENARLVEEPLARGRGGERQRESIVEAAREAAVVLSPMDLLRQSVTAVGQSFESWRAGIDIAVQLTQTVQGLAREIGQGLGGVASKAAMTFFDQIEDGKLSVKNLGAAFKEEAAAFLKETGSKLIGQGVFDILKGTSLGILTAFADPRAGALIALGGTEITAGLGMGGVGALIGRSVGKRGGRTGAEETPAPGASGGNSFGGNPSLGSRDRGVSQSTGGTLIVYMGGAPGSTTLYASDGDARALAPIGRNLARTIGAARQDVRLDTGF